jgi:hypothetical protein
VVHCLDHDVSLPLHIGTTVERLKILLRDRFAAPFERLQMMLDCRELNHEDVLAAVLRARVARGRLLYVARATAFGPPNT